VRRFLCFVSDVETGGFLILVYALVMPRRLIGSCSNPNAATKMKSTHGTFLFVAVVQFGGFSSEQLVEFIRIKLYELIG